MARVTFLDERCKGCLLCTTVCPKEIIRQSSRFNRKGYKVAEVTEEDMEKCTGCASCALICPDCAIRVYRPEKPAKGEKAKE
ncbi:4Fe-4S binding protein [Oleidesulfovibrio sp.]|uniref:4Fe-4S binding protein n=1 Tax=Oleidesulfovibrio sp. TaxID=2909707 RepID=UPI003A852A29